MSEVQGLSHLRGMIEGSSEELICNFCGTNIENGPVFFKGDIDLPPVHWQCLQDISDHPDLPKVIEWHKKTKQLLIDRAKEYIEDFSVNNPDDGSWKGR